VAKKNPYYSGPETDHFNGSRFFNPDGMKSRGLTDVLKWQFLESKAKWPKDADCPHAPAKPPERVDGAGLRVTMVGHATLLIQTAGLNILTDPVWAGRASPVSFFGPRRHRPPGIEFSDLPEIDVVLLTHNHYDHLCVETMGRLHQSHKPHVIVPLGNDGLVRSKAADLKVTAGDWDDRITHGPAVFHFERCHHWSARGIRDQSMALWSAYTIETPDRRVFHIGDTGFDAGKPYDRARDKHQRFDLAILPIGAYEPRWFMRDQHQDPDEAVEGFARLGADHGIGHHFGTFRLANEPMEEPTERLARAMAKHGMDPRRFRPLLPGEHMEIV